MKIYLASALTHVPENEFLNYTSMLHRFASVLSDQGQNQVLYALMNSDPQLAKKPPRDKPRLCYLWDREMVEDADVVVAEASFPSIGLGIELQIAEMNNIPVILCFEQSESKRSHQKFYENPDNQLHQLQIGDGYISLMALGLPNLFSLVPYSDERECFLETRRLLGMLNGPVGSVSRQA
ncbi:hypothetical protein FT688_11730 [Aeromonas hydrophila]|nr:hypothetical protein FT688_11730 [Aeromonas hydrophila]